MSDMIISENAIPSIVTEHLLLPNLATPIAEIRAGLSAATIFRCSSPVETLCLRAWPENGPNRNTLQMIGRNVERARASGVRYLPRYLLDRTGERFVHDGERYWELTQWMPGSADYLLYPSRSKLVNAVQSLARLHQVWSVGTGPDAARRMASPAVCRRADLLGKALEIAAAPQTHLGLAAGLDTGSLVGAQRNRIDASSPDSAALGLARRTDLAVKRYGPELMGRLRKIQQLPVTVHFVLRDIWSDHVLFTGDQVTGIIDFGAAAIDEPGTDLARLLGSLEPASAEGWLAGMEAYRELSPGIQPERVVLLDRVSCLLSAVQWKKWLVDEQRSFNKEASQLHARWKGFLDRLDCFPWQPMLS